MSVIDIGRVSFMLIFGLCLAGCVALQPQRSIYQGQQDTAVAFYPTASSNLLSCIRDSNELSRSEFKSLIKELSDEENQLDQDEELRYICLSLHKYAPYRQFKQGMDYLEKYVSAKPENKKSMQGILLLMQRINREIIRRWSLSNRLNDEKDVLEADNKALSQQVEALREQGIADTEHIIELQRQIEQLKNIENIIKNRDL